MTLLDAFTTTQAGEIADHQEVFRASTETQGLTVYLSDESLVIAFDGTHGVADWGQNFKAWKKSFSVGTKKYKAHAGFVEEYLSLREAVQLKVSTYQPAKIFVTGYSQGGALATLCWRDLVWWHKSIEVHGITFASPRVYGDSGAAEFVDTLQRTPGTSFRRLVAWGDPVPSLPPWWMGYSHVTPTRRIGEFKLFPVHHLPQDYETAIRSAQNDQD